MRYVMQFDAYMDMFDLTTIFQASAITLVLLLVFTLQVSERLDHLVKRTPSSIGWFRRVATSLYALAVLWLVLYQFESGWVPWPPVVGMIVASNINTLARFVIVYIDLTTALRAGTETAPLRDALSTMKTTYADEGKQMPPLQPR